MQENEVSFVAGDRIGVIELCNNVRDIDQDWYEGTVNGESGFFPANHVILVTEDAKASSPAPTPAPEITTVELKAEPELVIETIIGVDSVTKSMPEEEGSESEDSDANGWHIVTTDGGMVYYWNEDTGETSWDPPNQNGVVEENTETQRSKGDLPTAKPILAPPGSGSVPQTNTGSH